MDYGMVILPGMLLDVMARLFVVGVMNLFWVAILHCSDGRKNAGAGELLVTARAYVVTAGIALVVRLW